MSLNITSKTYINQLNKSELYEHLDLFNVPYNPYEKVATLKNILTAFCKEHFQSTNLYTIMNKAEKMGYIIRVPTPPELPESPKVSKAREYILNYIKDVKQRKQLEQQQQFENEMKNIALTANEISRLKYGKFVIDTKTPVGIKKFSLALEHTMNNTNLIDGYVKIILINDKGDKQILTLNTDNYLSLRELIKSDLTNITTVEDLGIKGSDEEGSNIILQSLDKIVKIYIIKENFKQKKEASNDDLLFDEYELSSMLKDFEEGENTYGTNGGAFFPYKFDLDKLKALYEVTEDEDIIYPLELLRNAQIVTNLKDNLELFNENCLIFALKQSRLPTDIVDAIAARVRGRYISTKNLHEVMNDMLIPYRINAIDIETNTYNTHAVKNGLLKKILKDEASKKLYDERVEKYGVTELLVLKVSKNNSNHLVHRNDDFINLFLAMNEYGAFVPITYGETVCLNSDLYKYINKDEMLYKDINESNQHRVSPNAVVSHITEYNEIIKLVCANFSEEKRSKYILKITENYDEMKELHLTLTNLMHEIYNIAKYQYSKFKRFTQDEYENIVKKLEKLTKKITSHYYKIVPNVIFADIECSVSKEIVNENGEMVMKNINHKPFMISYSSLENDKKIETIYGYDCINKFINTLEKDSVVYFHNLKYDGKFFYEYAVGKQIIKGTKVTNLQCKYGKEIYTDDGKVKFTSIKFCLKDSAQLLPFKLASFPKTFGITGIQKEVFPYNIYTEANVLNGWYPIKTAGKYDNWDKDKYTLFRDNCKSLDCIRVVNDVEEFNLEKYATFYCEQDVRILKIGFNKVRETLLQDPINLDILDYCTIHSVANGYATREVYSMVGCDSENDDDHLFRNSGACREQIQKNVYGGRCMSRDNKKWNVNELLGDFDAVSLYPSAMKRIKLPCGRFHQFTKEMYSTKYLLDHVAKEQDQPDSVRFMSSFKVTIKITKIGVKQAFPIMCYKDDEGNHNVNELGIMEVTNITFEDLVNFQNCEFEILGGVYTTGKKSALLSTAMLKLFNLRLKFKQEKNDTMQLFIKLIMNGIYGKTIPKAIDTQIVFKQAMQPYMEKGEMKYANKFASYNRLNNYKIKSATQIRTPDGEISQFHTWCIKENTAIDDCSTLNFVGVQILEMSKRIMNEVICLAESLGIKIYYQDTDSVHITLDGLKLLVAEFRKKYDRELVGTELGQFHLDYEGFGKTLTTTDKNMKNLVCISCIIVGKKCYADLVENDFGEKQYHLRMKGIPNNLLHSRCDKDINTNEAPELYKYLYNMGEDDAPVEFDLTEGMVSMVMDPTGNIINRDTFIRKMRF